MPAWTPGDRIVLRETRQGVVWSAKPATVVRDTPDLVALSIAPGSRWKQPRSRDGRRVGVVDVVAGTWELADATWMGGGALALCPPGASHALVGFWNETHTALMSWYLNLQEPLRRTPIGFDTLDLILDLVVSADRRSWCWKDEDEFAEAQAHELIDAPTAAAIRAEGRRAHGLLLAGAPPYDPEWETWKPDPTWTVPTLPAGWDIVAE